MAEQSCWVGAAGVTTRLGKISSGTDGEFDMRWTLVKHNFGKVGKRRPGGCVVGLVEGLGLTGLRQDRRKLEELTLFLLFF